MTDPFSYFPPDLIAIIFTFVNFRVINIAKRFHTNPETIYAFFSIMVGLIYAVITTPPMFDSWAGVLEYAMSFGSKISLIGLATSGVWHRYKKLIGKNTQEQLEAVAAGVEIGIAIEKNTESGSVEVKKE